MPTSQELFAQVKIIHAEAAQADGAYSAALKAAYKGNAGDMRYRPDLQPQHIRELRDRYVDVSERWGALWQEACDLERSEQRAAAER